MSTIRLFPIKFQRPPVPVRVYQVIFIWVAATLAWHSALTYLGGDIPNVIYLEWGGIAITMVIWTKFFVRLENLTFAKFLGSKLPVSSIGELSFALATSVLLGIACWALLVMLSAKVDIDWTYKHWGLLTIDEFQAVTWRPSWLVLDFLCGVILVPITEEIVFRGFVLRRLSEKYRLSKAIVISSLLFAVFHIDQSFLGSFIHGVFFALLALRFGSLYAPMIVHGGYNAIVSMLQRGIGISMVVDRTRVDSIDYWLPEMLLLIMCIIALLGYFRFCLRKIRIATTKPE
ncbi:CPBP family intramembrane glutamic endopeptidase [Massilia aquatica]|uniref:CPBP family intramembrane metalloprotease n=1 Tax=Massilia aquatica TaxID=2609000 RepID=A0ABX0MCI6_9BURK|nr:CPBP family intramembrane glutamic endopeptidase [Massilia aquatica]NHZ39846.1 CPBP family intramembrane metalloprotease [Massilia aquatica]